MSPTGRAALAVLLLLSGLSGAPGTDDLDDLIDTVGQKLGYNWKQGPFEMIDALGPKWFAAKLKIENMDVPEILQKVGEATFYRIENGHRQYFGTDGKYHDVKRPDGVLLLSDIKLSSEPVLKNGSAKVVALARTIRMTATLIRQRSALLSFGHR